MAAEAEIQTAAARLANATISLKNTRIVAPFAGRVVRKLAEAGEVPTGLYQSAAGGIVELVDFSSLVVEADASEGRVSSLKVGDAAEITLDAFPSKRLRDEVSEVRPTVDRQKATVLVRAKFLDPVPEVLPQMAAKVLILSKPLENKAFDKSSFFFHMKYLNEGVPEIRKEEIGWFGVRVNDPSRVRRWRRRSTSCLNPARPKRSPKASAPSISPFGISPPEDSGFLPPRIDPAGAGGRSDRDPRCTGDEFRSFLDDQFSELLRGRVPFSPTLGILAAALAFASVMGLLGGLFPAIRAARVSPVQAMRE